MLRAGKRSFFLQMLLFHIIIRTCFRYEDVDFNATLYVDPTSTESGYIGLVFGYQREGEMYLLLWRQDYHTWLHGQCDTDCTSEDAMGGTTGL